VPAEGFLRRGWVKFPYDPAVAEWLSHATPAALAAIDDPKNANWLRCGGTWFAGVNVLPNQPDGSVEDSGPLAGNAVSFLASQKLPFSAWDRAQISVTHPGYPRRGSGESDVAFRFRRDRDAAHVDGLKPFGPDRRRKLGEFHAFILGLPMTKASSGASPLVVWEGSHEIVRQTLASALAGSPPESWGDVDLTETYHAARRHVFETCRRVEVYAMPGEAYLVHRLALHGVAPWALGATAPPEGRVIAYFRPEFSGTPADWLQSP